ncbi:MAG: shikimate dehydrogenase, partial [Candidatus Thorarchaeota archaeon]
PTLDYELQSFVESVKDGIVEGANITIPYKTDVINHVAIISKEATAIGSVNTLYRIDDAVAGCNTDVSGFLESLRENAVALKGIRATILGAGGVARSVAYALVNKGVSKLDILNRSVARAENLVSRLGPKESCEVHFGSLSKADVDLSETDLLVNCTPIGMIGHSVNESPLSNNSMMKDMVVMDLVYNPRRTKLLQEAEKAGCVTIDGTGMLVHQGVVALEMWVGEKPPIDVMRNALVRALGG